MHNAIKVVSMGETIYRTIRYPVWVYDGWGEMLGLKVYGETHYWLLYDAD
jgi:hypothetical protein